MVLVPSPSKRTVFFAACQCVFAVNALILIAIYGWNLPLDSAKDKPYVLVFTILTGLSGLLETWGAYRNRDWNLGLKGTGVLMAGGLLIDLWASSGRLQGRHALMLGYIGISALPILWSEVRTMIKLSRPRG